LLNDVQRKCEDLLSRTCLLIFHAKILVEVVIDLSSFCLSVSNSHDVPLEPLKPL